MRFQNFTYCILSLIISLLVSCNGIVKKDNKLTQNDYKEPLIKANKALVKSEDELIKSFINRYGWEMKKTGTGLRYMIYQHGKGQLAKEGDVAFIDFSISLLNGDTCYASNINGSMDFLIGKGGVISGLEEGILLLKNGDRVKFIIPSHLAYGLVGDFDKIPAKSTLIYDLKVLELKQLN